MCVRTAKREGPSIRALRVAGVGVVREIFASLLEGHMGSKGERHGRGSRGKDALAWVYPMEVEL